MKTEQAATDPHYRSRILRHLELLGGNARKPGQFGVYGSGIAETFGTDDSLRYDADKMKDPLNSIAPPERMKRKLERRGVYHRDPSVNEAITQRLKANQMFDEAAAMPPSARRDVAIADAARRMKETEKIAQDTQDRLIEQTRDRRNAANPNQLDLYRNTKNLIERHGTDAIRAGKRALGSPAVRRGLGVAAGLLGSKAALAATSGGADLVMELAVGAPKAFFEGYNRSQDPYEQVKYVAEGLGPINELQSKSLDALSYDDVVRLQQEGHLTPKAEQQYRQHVIETEGFDPDEVYRMGAAGKKPRVVLDEIEITADAPN